MVSRLMRFYEHRQLSPWLLLPLILVAAAYAGFALTAPPAVVAKTLAVVVVAVVTVPFCSLRTSVDPQGVSWAFLLGFPCGEIRTADIADVQITRTTFWEGWGIHWTLGHGWLWNVSGFNAVKIRKRNGSVITLGTDDPRGFYDAIVRVSNPGSTVA